MDATQMVDLGFVEAEVPVGTHVCQIYSNERDREESLQRYLVQGLRDGERCACFSDRTTEEDIRACLRGELANARFGEAISHSAVSNVYFRGGIFDPDRMLALLRDFYERSARDGYTAARIIGEMSPRIHSTPGGSRLLEYESKVSLLLRSYPVTAVCQYDARAFDGASIMDVLKVHPMMVVRGAVVRNPFFVQPEECLN